MKNDAGKCPTVGANSSVDNSLLGTLTDDELIDRTETLALVARGMACDLALHVAELDRRRALVKRGYSSTFDYCTRRLHFSEGAAYRLIRAARSIKLMPAMEEMLRQGTLSIEGAALLHPFLGDEDASALLLRCANLSTRAIESLLARRKHAPPVRDSIRPIGVQSASELEASPAPSLGTPLVLEAGEVPSLPQEERSMVRISFAADECFLSRLRRAKAVMLHKYPEGRLEDVLGDALEALLDKKDMDRIVARRAKWRERTAERRKRRS